MDFIKRIEKFNKDRRLLEKEFDIYTELSFIYEELSEGLRSNSIEDVIDAFADIVVFSIGALLKLKVTNPDVFMIQLEELNMEVKKQREIVDIDDIDIVDLVAMSLKIAEEAKSESDIQNYIKYISDLYYQEFGEIQQYVYYKQVFLKFTQYVNYYINEIQFIITNEDDLRYSYMYVFSKIALNALLLTELLGYDSIKVMDEVTKHILSRKGQYDESQGKWIKDKNQDPSTLYIPDFSKCYIGVSRGK